MRRVIVLALAMFLSIAGFSQIDFSALVGETVSFRSYNYPDRFIRHQGFDGKLTPVQSDLDKNDASFKIVPALNGRSGYVSFIAVNYPDQYLNAKNFMLKLSAKEDNQQYKDNASFRGVPGLAGEGYSFESASSPNHFLRHSSFMMRLNQNDNSQLFKKDATFNLDIALSTNFEGHYRLKTMFRGEGECLEGNQSSSNYKNGNAFMDECQNVTGQMWKIVEAGNGYYRLHNKFRGDGECLEGNQAGSNYMNGAAFMDKKQNVTGQFWRFVPVGNGYYRLKNMFRGEGECLEGNQSASTFKNGAAFMDKCKNVSGQLWKIVSMPATLACENSKTGAKITLLSKEGQNIKLGVDWDEGATLSSSLLDITNGTCVSCPPVGGIGRPHGKSATYEVKQTDPSKPVIVKWGGQPGNKKFCGEDRSMFIPAK